MVKFYADLWFGPFVYKNFEIEPGPEFQPIYVVHPIGVINVGFKPEGTLEMPDVAPLKKMTFDYESQLGARHLKYRFIEEK